MSASATLELHLYTRFITSPLGLLPWADAVCCPAWGSTVPGCHPCTRMLPLCAGAAWGVWITQLGCGTGLPLNSTSLASPEGTEGTEGGDQPWGGRWESAKESTAWAPKLLRHPAKPPTALLSACCFIKGAQKEKKHSKSLPACAAGADRTEIETAWLASPPTPALPWPQHADGGGSPTAFHPQLTHCSGPSVLLFGSPAKHSNRLFKSVLSGFLITRRQIIYCSGK